MRAAIRSVGLVLATVLVALLGLVILELVLAAVGQDPLVVPADDLFRSGREHAWSDPAVIVSLVALGAFGVAMLSLALWPAAPTALEAGNGSDGDVEIAIERTALERALARRMERLPGTKEADVRLRRRKVRIGIVATRQADTAQVERDVSQAATAVLDRLHLDKQPKVAASVRGGDR